MTTAVAGQIRKLLRWSSCVDRLEHGGLLLADADGVIQRFLRAGHDRKPDSLKIALGRPDWHMGGEPLSKAGDWHSHPLSMSLQPSDGDRQAWRTCAQRAGRAWVGIVCDAPRWGKPELRAWRTSLDGRTAPVRLQEVAA